MKKFAFLACLAGSMLAQSTPPFGAWDSPSDGATGLTGAVALSGWALDDARVSKVSIYRDPVAGETGSVYIGDALLVNGARPDVAALYPSVPFNTRAGWGYLLLTNVLPGTGNGTYTFRAYAYDEAGNQTPLGAKTITCANATATKPFGALDFPQPGEVVSGATYMVRGWALTPGTAKIAEDGSKIFVWVDGQLKGTVNEYNLPRLDVSALFPTYTNANGSFARYRLDTTALSNGVHTISLSARDDQGRSDGIGSRYFEVNNAPVVPQQDGSAQPKSAVRASGAVREGLWVRIGYDPEVPVQRVEGDAVEVRQAERLELHLPGVVEQGCLIAGGECIELPAGSALRDGVFYWQIDAAFLGEYDLRFTGLGETIVRVRVK